MDNINYNKLTQDESSFLNAILDLYSKNVKYFKEILNEFMELCEAIAEVSQSRSARK